MNKIILLLLFILTITSLGCAVQRQSRFTTNQIQPGMTKEAVIARFGKPYKESSSMDRRKIFHEKLYYKEQVYLGRWYEVNSILHFENSVFKSLEQGDEQVLYNDNRVVTP
jgi:hypothetical protein